MTSEMQKADLLGPRLVDGGTEMTMVLMEELAKRYNVGFREGDITPLIEVIVFYMHLADRVAFAYSGASKRNVFCDQLVLAVLEKLLRGLSEETSAEGVREALLETYNRRQIEYANYKALAPKKGEPLKGTLGWEFSKILFGLLDDQNPATLVFLDVFLAKYSKVMLNDVLKIEEVLQS